MSRSLDASESCKKSDLIVHLFVWSQPARDIPRLNLPQGVSMKTPDLASVVVAPFDHLSLVPLPLLALLLLPLLYSYRRLRDPNKYCFQPRANSERPL